MPERVQPDARLLGRLARATLDNAVGLLGDARVLADCGRNPRSYALAILAAEEFGKHLSVVGVASVPDDHTIDWAKFWRNFASHKAKYGVALAAITSAVPRETSALFRSQFSEQVEEDQTAKFRALYVDLVDDLIVGPSDVTPALASEAIRVVGEMVGMWAKHWDGVDLEGLFERGVVHRHDKVSAAMAAASAEELALLLDEARRD